MKFFQNFSIRKLLYNKKFAVSLSVIVAFIFWLIITLDQNPERERSFTSVPITVSTQGTILAEQGIDVINKDSILKNASVTVSGPNYVVSSLSSDDFKIYADLSGVSKPGSYTISLSAVKNTAKSDFKIVEVIPETIQVEFDYYDTKSFDIEARVDGVSTAVGLIADPAKVTNSEQQAIEIRGPRTEIEKIDTVVAYYKGDDVIDTTETFEGSIIIYDSNGNRLDASKFELPYDTLDISVPVFKEKILSIEPTFINADAQLIKYLQDKKLINLSERQVVVYGQPEKIDTLNYVELVPIDFNTISKKNNKISDVELYLEDGVGVRSGFDSVDVTFNLDDFVEKKITISQSDVKHNGTLSAGVKADFEVKNIIICGPKSTISEMDAATENTISLSVILSGKVAGNGTAQRYNVPYVVDFPDGLYAWEVVNPESKTIQVSLLIK